MSAVTKPESREILAGAICNRLRGREAAVLALPRRRPPRRPEILTLDDKLSEVCQGIMDDSPAGPFETIAAATARVIWADDLSGRAWSHVRRLAVRKLELFA